MIRYLFRATPAFVVSSTDTTRSFHLVDRPPEGVAPIVVHINRKPSTARLSSPPSPVEVDDLSPGGLSHLASSNGEPLTGKLYLEQAFWERCNADDPQRIPALPPGLSGPREYEFAAVYYDDLKLQRRYRGFHAIVRGPGVRPGFTACTIWPAGCSHELDHLDRVDLDIDLESVEQCDAALGLLQDVEEKWSRLKSTSLPGQEGALFLESTWASQLGLAVPKLPMALGGGDELVEGPALARSIANGRVTNATTRPHSQSTDGLTFRRLLAEQRRRFGAGVNGVPIPDGRPADHVNISVMGASLAGALQTVAHKIRTGNHEFVSSEGAFVMQVDDLAGLYHMLRDDRGWPPPGVEDPLRGVQCRLDLIGHTYGDDCIVMLGKSPITEDNLELLQVFRDLAREGVLAKLGITEIGIVGCRSGATEKARSTMRRLRQTLLDATNPAGSDDWGPSVNYRITGCCPLVTAAEFTMIGYNSPWAEPTCTRTVDDWGVPDSPPFDRAVLLAPATRPFCPDRVRTVPEHEADTFLADVQGCLRPSNGGWAKGEFVMMPDVHVVIGGSANGDVLQRFDVTDSYYVVQGYSDQGRPISYQVENPDRLRTLIASRSEPVDLGFPTKPVRKTKFPVTIDASALSYKGLIVPAHGETTTGVLELSFPEGSYPIRVADGVDADVRFRVTGRGTIAYDQAFERFLDGAGTRTLVLRGYPVFVDASGVPGSFVALPGCRLRSASPSLGVRLLPSRYVVEAADGVAGAFVLGVDGSVSVAGMADDRLAVETVLRVRVIPAP